MIELIWDVDRRGTVAAPSGASFDAGDRASFSPDDLMAAAASSCLMRTFLQLAAEGQVAVLSYAANAHVESGRGPLRPRVHVRVYVTASEGTDSRRITLLGEQAAHISPMAQLLGERLRVEHDVRVLCGPHVMH